MLGGAAHKDATLFGPTAAAWAQAVFAATAVFASAWLQERLISRQSEVARKQRYENAASAARWVLQTFTRLQVAVAGGDLSLGDFASLDGQGAFSVALKALGELRLSEIDDETLATAVFALKGMMGDIARRRQAQIEQAVTAPNVIVNEGWLPQDRVAVFNSASAVERAAAVLCGRPAAL